MDAKKINYKLRGEADRKATTLHLSSTIYGEFRDACGEIAPSRVIEEMMKEYINTSKGQKPKPTKQKKSSVKKN